MNKIFIGLISFFLFTTSIEASKWDIPQPKTKKTSEDITYEVNYYEDNDKEIGLLNFIIPDDYDADEIIIVPSVEDMYYSPVMPSNIESIKINIINNSNFDYAYKNNSLTISTIDNEANYDSIYGDIINNSTGFNEKPIYYMFGSTRCNNNALKSLITKNNMDINIKSASDENISNLLKNIKDSDEKELYPNGIDDLDKYYLNFYNNKYNTKYNSLEEMPLSIIKEVLDGEIIRIDENGNRSIPIIESNQIITELAYNYFYNVILATSFNSKLDKDNIADYSIGSYMRKEKAYQEANDYLNENLKVNKNDNTMLDIPNIYYNKSYITDMYKYYNYGFYIDFTLEKKLKKSTINIYHIDTLGNLLAPIQKYTGLIGDTYQTEKIENSQYRLVEVLGDEEGYFTQDTEDIVYIYDKKVIDVSNIQILKNNKSSFEKINLNLKDSLFLNSLNYDNYNAISLILTLIASFIKY